MCWEDENSPVEAEAAWFSPAQVIIFSALINGFEILGRFCEKRNPLAERCRRLLVS